MTFIIPPRDRPFDVERFVDPTTGATYLRPRPQPKKTPDSNSRGEPLPATCSTPHCVHAGLAHDHCSPGYYHQPTPYAYAVPVAGHSYYRSPVPLPQADGSFASDQNAFQRWLQSFPHWRLPREAPPGWKFPRRPDVQDYPVRSQVMPFHNFPQDPVAPVYATPHFYPQPMPTPLIAVTTPASVWPSAPEVPDRPPDLMEWNDVNGGRLQWTPHPWVAHPLPHPQIPAHQFWSHAGGAGAAQAWRTPGGGIPTPGFEMARAYQITGGHPLPGTDPFWTPTRRPVPLGSPYAGPGVFLSPWLAPNARNAGAPHVLWDAAVEPPYRIRRVTGRGGIVDFASTDFFKEPATDPSAATLQVHLPGMRSTWGPVVVKKSSGSAVSVGDVFQAVWNYLHKPISHDDYMAISATGGRQQCGSIEYAMYRRCLNSAALYDYTFSQGIKRVDLLEGNTVYWGTWLGYNPDGTWFLSMGFMPPTQLV